MADLTSLSKEFKQGTNLSFDIRFTDDTTIMSTVFEKLLSTEELQAPCGKWSMKINFSKRKVIASSEKRITLEGEELEIIGELYFFGSIVPSTEREVLVDAQPKHRQPFGRLRNGIFSKRSISTSLKARLYGALLLPIAIYGGDTWTLRSREIQSLEVVEMRFLQAIVTRCYQGGHNIKIREDTFTPESITDVIRQRRLRWFGHVCPMQRDNVVCQA